MVRRLIFMLAVMLITAPAWAADSAAIFMYHRFGESGYASTNTTLDQFEVHLQELREGGYNVWPLPRILEKLHKGEDVPDKTVGITIDDAYASVYNEAWPRLRRYNFPFTLFIATDPLDNNTAGYMTWNQVRELARNNLVTIGSQTAGHPHMAAMSADTMRRELQRSQARFEAELGRAPKLFAYPYGEYSTRTQEIVKEAGFAAAFGQHSGAFDGGSDFYALPRFALNEQYGDLDRFRLAANTLALPVKEITPSNPLISKEHNPPAFGFTLERKIGNLSALNCFASGKGKAQVTVLGEDRVEVRVSEPFATGRARINCTYPGPNGRFYWFGRQFFIQG